LYGSEFIDIRNSKLTNGIVGLKADDKRPGLEMLNFTPGLINRIVISELTGKTGEETP